MAKIAFFDGNHKRFLSKSVCKSGISVLLLLLSTFSAYAQQTILSGKILDERTKAVVLGANIRIKGETGGSSTDENGNFSVKVKSLPITLLITSIDYKNQELDVYEAVPTIIYLTEDINRLNAVVVVGYGTQKRSQLTGSITSVSTDLIKQTPITSVESSLQGKAAGVQLTQTSGQPGAAISIRIRGGNSITGGNEPLYVIDGFPVYNDNSSTDAGVVSGSSINALASLNPSDIESIDILKDASATAIYGSRGANGVVIITTKKGKAGKVQISYDVYTGFQQLGKKISLLNARQFGELRNDAIQTSNDVVTQTGSGTIRPLAYTTTQLDSLSNSNNDWQSAAFRIAPIQNHQLSISGGDDKTLFAISGNYLKQDGILLNSDFTRFSGRFNLERKVTDKFKVGENFTIAKTSANEAPAGIVNTILATRPDFPIYNADGSYTYKQPGEAALGNPIATLTEQTNLTSTFRVFGNTFAEYKILKELTAKVSFGIDQSYNEQYRYVPSTLYEGNGYGYAYRGEKSTGTWLNENTLNYSKIFKEKHSLDLLAGFTQQQTNTNGFTATASNFANELLTYHDLYSGQTLVASTSYDSQSTLLSYLGRATYSYDDRYSVSVSARRDGSSRFGINNKWGFFPSAAFAWNAKNESFLRNVREISALKTRISYGLTGNQEIGLYKSLATMSSSYSYIFGNTLVSGYAPTNIANANLSWEKTAQSDFGLDLGLFNDRINFIFDAYYKKTSDLLTQVQTPATTGVTSALKNVGVVENKGIELTLNTENIKTKSFSWSSSIVFALNRNKILSLGDGVNYINNYSTDGTFISKVGYPVGSYYVLLTDGVYQSTDDIANLPKYKSPTLPGYQKYKDINHDGTIGIANDRVIVGSAQPKFTYGFTNTISYNIFDLSFLFQGVYGNKLYNYTKNYLDLGTGYTNATTSLLDRWTSTNTNTTQQRAIQDPAPLASDKYIEDGSYLRLKNLTFAVNVPKKILKLVKISALKLYVSGQNLLTWTNYTGYDPEANRNEQSSTLGGYDNGVYPISKVYTAGASITF